MSDDDAMTIQHGRVLAAEAQLFTASVAYEMVAASFDVAARARTAAEMSLADEQRKLREREV